MDRIGKDLDICQIFIVVCVSHGQISGSERKSFEQGHRKHTLLVKWGRFRTSVNACIAIYSIVANKILHNDFIDRNVNFYPHCQKRIKNILGLNLM